MNMWMANTIISARKTRIKALNNVRFCKGDYEYKLVYEGGFFGFLTVYKRSAYKARGHFKYVDTFAEDDLNMDDVISFIKDKVA